MQSTRRPDPRRLTPAALEPSLSGLFQGRSSNLCPPLQRLRSPRCSISTSSICRSTETIFSTCFTPSNSAPDKTCPDATRHCCCCCSCPAPVKPTVYLSHGLPAAISSSTYHWGYCHGSNHPDAHLFNQSLATSLCSLRTTSGSMYSSQSRTFPVIAATHTCMPPAPTRRAHVPCTEGTRPCPHWSSSRTLRSPSRPPAFAPHVQAHASLHRNGKVTVT